VNLPLLPILVYINLGKLSAAKNKIRLCFYIISLFVFSYIRIYQSIIINLLNFAVQSIQKYGCWLEKENVFLGGISLLFERSQ